MFSQSWHYVVKKMDPKTQFKLFLEAPGDPLDATLALSLHFTNNLDVIMGIFESFIIKHFWSEHQIFEEFSKIVEIYAFWPPKHG